MELNAEGLGSCSFFFFFIMPDGCCWDSDAFNTDTTAPGVVGVAKKSFFLLTFGAQWAKNKKNSAITNDAGTSGWTISHQRLKINRVFFRVWGVNKHYFSLWSNNYSFYYFYSFSPLCSFKVVMISTAAILYTHNTRFDFFYMYYILVNCSLAIYGLKDVINHKWNNYQ